jgi:hypothetical protein
MTTYTNLGTGLGEAWGYLNVTLPIRNQNQKVEINHDHLADCTHLRPSTAARPHPVNVSAKALTGRDGMPLTAPVTPVKTGTVGSLTNNIRGQKAIAIALQFAMKAMRPSSCLRNSGLFPSV